MAAEVKRDVLTLEQAGTVLNLSAETIRRRIKAQKITAWYDRDSRKFGYIIDRMEFVRYLRSIHENERADLLERQGMEAFEAKGKSTTVLK